MVSHEGKFGLLVPLEAKADKVDAVTEFLGAGYDLVNAEPETVQWFGLREKDTNTFVIFDTFPTEAGRAAHLSGRVAEALMANGPELLHPAPLIGHVEILAQKVQSTKGSGDKKAGLTVGLKVLFTAKPDKVKTVRDFLISALPMVEAEFETPVWYAIEYPSTCTFGIMDFFVDEKGRNTHLNGKVAAALFGAADELLEATPHVAKVDVLAAKVLV